MNKVYVIIQSSGSHAFSDAIDINLCARFSKEDAEKEVEILKARHEKVRSIHPIITRAYYDAVQSLKGLNKTTKIHAHASESARKIAIENNVDELGLEMLGFNEASIFEPYAFDSNDYYYYEELPIE